MADQGVPAVKTSRILGLLTRRAVPPLAAALMRPGTRRPDVLLPLLALSAWTAAEALAEDDAANLAAARGQHQDRGTRYAMVGAHLLAWWLPLLNAPRRHRWPSGPATGVALILAGGGLRVLAIRTLGSRFTGHVRTVPQQPVCDHGPYALVRHPSYLGLLGLNAGPALSRGAWPAALGAAAATMAANACRVRVEEQALLTQLGQPYADYAARTPRFVPRLRARDEQRPLTEQSQNLV